MRRCSGPARAAWSFSAICSTRARAASPARRSPSCDPPEDLRINCVNAPAFVPPFVLRHEPADSPEGYTLAGHLHPGLVLAGPALQRERLPCFWLTPRTAVLPAFGSFTGLAPVHPGPDDHVFVVAEQDVIPVG
jgi:metallophosphoesterase superfamily enzyme